MSLFPQPQVTEVILHRSKLMATLWVISGSDDVAGSVTVPLRWKPAKTQEKKGGGAIRCMFNYPDWQFKACSLITMTGNSQLMETSQVSIVFDTTESNMVWRGSLLTGSYEWTAKEERSIRKALKIGASPNLQGDPSVQNTLLLMRRLHQGTLPPDTLSASPYVSVHLCVCSERRVARVWSLPAHTYTHVQPPRVVKVGACGDQL